MLKLSCCTLAYIVSTPLDEAIRRIAEAGYKGIDLYTGPPHLYPGHYSEEERRAVRELIDDQRLELTGFAVAGGILNLGLNFSHSNKKVRDETLQYYRDNVNLAADIGCPLINVLTGHCLYGTPREQGRKWTMEAFQELAALAEEKNVILGLHPQYIGDSPLMLTIDDALEMIKELNSKMVKIIFDTAQQNITYPNFADDIRKAGQHLCYIHAADNDGIHWTHVTLGKGTVNWDGLVATLKSIGYDGYVCVQTWSGAPIDADAMIRDSKEYMDGVLRKYR
ncbi:MAG: sugar phosphate isomerase/epimerase family protein [Promethearchaeati archaeon SRVP18_Atabeyarchaeia-1]